MNKQGNTYEKNRKYIRKAGVKKVVYGKLRWEGEGLCIVWSCSEDRKFKKNRNAIMDEKKEKSVL